MKQQQQKRIYSILEIHQLFKGFPLLFLKESDRYFLLLHSEISPKIKGYMRQTWLGVSDGELVCEDYFSYSEFDRFVLVEKDGEK